MAITAPTVQSDLSGFITPEDSAPIFERAARQSVVQQLSRRVPLGPSGTKIPVVTGRPTAGWVGEGETKPASAGAMTSKTISPEKLAAIMVVSAEVARLNPGEFVTTMQNSLAETFAVAFDYAALHDAGPDGTAGAGPFSTYIDQSTKTQELGTNTAANGGIWRDLVDGLKKVVTDVGADGRRYRLTGWALDDLAMLGAVDTAGNPIFVEQPLVETAGPTRAARLMSRPSFMGEGIATADQRAVVGYGGDWSQTAWGAIGGISYRISTEATVTINGALTSLWEKNLVAILAEAEYGWLVNDPEAFVKLTNTDNSPVTSS
jgi:HK97 family phage major capsid protein